jgi:hypothetical protein
MNSLPKKNIQVNTESYIFIFSHHDQLVYRRIL